MKSKILIFTILFLGIGYQSFSQTKKQFINAAEREYGKKNYYGALEFFNTVLEFDENDVDILFKAAESARQFDAYEQAAMKYSKLVDSLNDQKYPQASFYLASMKQRMGKYEDARKYYNMYVSEYSGNDEKLTNRAKEELKNIEYAIAVTKNPKKNIKIEKLGPEINTPASEVSPFSVGEKLYFSSMRFKEENPLSYPAKDVGKLMESRKDKSAVLIDGPINSRDQLVSNVSLSKDGTKAYYTVCNYLNDSDIHCEIFRSDVSANGAFSNETKLPDPINVPGSTSTHPHIAIDKASGREILYFVSDRVGGKGGLDIWFSLLDAKYGYSQPNNLEQVNTAANEVTPFYNETNDFLYFSADEREGLGGYDIYKISKVKDTYGAVVALGSPFNSSYHDIYYMETKDGNTVYISSNREGAAYLDELHKSCCYDIFKLDIVKIELDLNALTFDKLTERPVNFTTVTVFDQDTGVELAKIYNDKGNDHTMQLIEDRNYMIVATRENYNPDTLRFSTRDMDKTESIIKKMYLTTDMILLDAYTFAKIGNTPLDSTTIVIKDLSTGNTRDIIEFNPLSNEFHFMIDRGKEYRITASKDGYTEDVASIDTRPYDRSALIRKDLYLDKFILQDLLPIALYFDNDLPDLKSKSSTTSAVYGTLVESYMDRKESYKEKYSKPLPVNEREQVKEDYEIFFEGDVKGGFDKFRKFADNLLLELQAGNKVELILKGYASPRADSKYNLALGQRRVNSVKNDLINSNAEILTYFQNGLLVITDISFGKELAPEDVESSIGDERNSIYNLKAAKERRVEILRASRN